MLGRETETETDRGTDRRAYRDRNKEREGGDRQTAG